MMMPKNKKSWLIFSAIHIIALLLLSFSGAASIKEKKVLMRSSFGDFTKADRIQKQGKAVLKLWPSYAHYCGRLPLVLRRVVCLGIEKLPIEFDEIWVSSLSSGAIAKLYWKDNVVQAFTSEYLYDRDPDTGKKLLRPAHQLICIFDRNLILSML